MALLNSVLSTCHSIMSFFMLPEWVRERTDRIRKRFMWNGTGKVGNKYHLVSWGQLYRRRRVVVSESLYCQNGGGIC